MKNNFQNALFEDKANELIQRKEKELNIYVVEKVLDDKNDLHILAKRHHNGLYTIWTSYYTGELETSYENFYNGQYDFDLVKGVAELKRRVQKESCTFTIL